MDILDDNPLLAGTLLPDSTTSPDASTKPWVLWLLTGILVVLMVSAVWVRSADWRVINMPPRFSTQAEKHSLKIRQSVHNLNEAIRRASKKGADYGH